MLRDVLSMVGTPSDSAELVSAELVRIVTEWWWVTPTARNSGLAGGSYLQFSELEVEYGD